MTLSNKIGDIFKSVKGTLKKYSPQIGAAAAISCFGYSVYKAVVVTPKANEELEAKKKELNTEKLPIKESAKIIGKNYGLAIGSFAVGSAIVIDASHKQFKLGNAYAGVVAEYSGLRTLFREYKAQVAETVGQKKAEKIQYELDQKDLDKHPPVEGVNIYMPGNDGVYRTLIYEPISNHYFWDVPDNFDAYVGRAQRLMSQNYNGEMTAYEWISILPKEVMDSFPDGEADRLMHLVWTRDVPYEGFDAELGDSFTINDQNNKWYGYSCRRIRYGDDPAPTY